MSTDPGNSQPQKDDLPLLVILFFNLVVFVVLAVFFGRKVPSECVSSTGAGLSLAIVALELFHLTWRFFGGMLRNLVIKIGGHEIQIGQLADLLEQLHPRALSEKILFLQAFLFFAIAGFLWFPPLSPFSSDRVPDIQHFLIHKTDGSIESYGLGGLLRIEKDTRVRVEAGISEQPGISCTWSTIKGTLLPAGECMTQYGTPIEGNRDTLTLLVRSPCKTYQSFAVLHIEIVQAEP